MQKWTTTNFNGMTSTTGMNPNTSIGGNKVSLAKILTVRPNLNEVECWALLGQTAHALQDVLLRANGNRRHQEFPLIYPQRILASTTGRITFDNSSFDAKPEFIHPLLASNQLYRSDYSESEMEQLGIYSLGKSLQACHCLHPGGVLTDLVGKMTSAIDTVSLLHVLECVDNQWKILVGSSPISRFVAQLCKLTLGWTMTSIPASCGLSQTSTCRPALAETNHHEISHIEFSRLNDSSSSSGSTSPNLPRPPRLPVCSSPILYNNNHIEQVPKLPPKPGQTGGTKRKLPQRNPSRLYRIVKPLTEISISPSPATNRCIGPEFFVMQENQPKVLDLATNFSRKDFVSKQVDVVMLNGQRFFIHVNASSITAGEILDNVLRDEDIKEASLFTLALYKNQEFWPLANDTKLSKVVQSWKDNHKTSTKMILGETVTLYLRVKYFSDEFKCPENKHQFYLQLRQDVLNGKYHMSDSEYLSLAGMALQVEFGDFSRELHNEVYFDLEHYLPCHLHQNPESKRSELRSSLVKLHQAHLGQSQSKTEMKFCQELQRHDNYGFHFFQVFSDKKLSSSKLLAIHLQGIFLFEASKSTSVPHRVLASFFWHQITRIQYDNSKFQLLVQDAEKLKYYTSESKSKVMFDSSSTHHQHSNQLRLNSKVVNNTEYKEPKPRPMRSLKSRLLRRQNSQHKLYTTRKELDLECQPQKQNSPSLRRSTTVAPSKMTKDAKANDAKYLVKRLAHYSSMADALVGGGSKKSSEKAKESVDLNVSDKENSTPNRNYRYKVYLEPEEDQNTQKLPETRVPLQERPALQEISSKRLTYSTNPTARRKSETLRQPQMISTTQRKGRSRMGIVTSSSTPTTTTIEPSNPSSALRMGTRLPMAALHREKLRTFLTKPEIPTSQKTCENATKKLDLDYDTMEYKSILPPPAPVKAVVIEDNFVPYADPSNESLSESLVERFDNMETDETVAERQIVPVTVSKDFQGRLGLKVTGLSSGIYVDDFDNLSTDRMEGTFKKGDRIVAINGRSLENVKYETALELMRNSGPNVQFLVSQIKD